MSQQRKPVAVSVQNKVLNDCRYRCAICFGLHGDLTSREGAGQIAHIDQDNSNNNESNLVFLCFDHHNQYDSQTRQGKNITAGNLKTWKKLLIEAIEQNAHFVQNQTQLPPQEKAKILSFLNVLYPITRSLCYDRGSDLAYRISTGELDYIKNNFSNWLINSNRSQFSKICSLQDSAVSILWSIHNSYYILKTLDDKTLLRHEIPTLYYHKSIHLLSINEDDSCFTLSGKVEAKEKWIINNLKRLLTIYHDLDSLIKS
ncbi:hypothetical protein [Providencia sp. PROV039]|uniref:hypothetical protein n=1 Tax=Providencia sp. PROV039 TaxID=2949770 RepID=UPI00234B2AE4|nr:hypothetical protein [Providencia sp. PROV039]